MIDYNTILNRNHTYNNIKEELELFENEKNNITQKRGFYIYGDSGIGKTKFVESLLEDNDYRFDCVICLIVLIVLIDDSPAVLRGT